MINESVNKKTILVIEDERPLLQVIEAKLLKTGFDVITARTIDQGLHYLEEVQAIDGIWLDHYLLGEKTGLDFVAKIKIAEGKWNKIPIFVVSNTASKDNLESYIKLGVTQYSVKSDHRLDEIAEEMQDFLNTQTL